MEFTYSNKKQKELFFFLVNFWHYNDKWYTRKANVSLLVSWVVSLQTLISLSQNTSNQSPTAIFSAFIGSEKTKHF